MGFTKPSNHRRDLCLKPPMAEQVAQQSRGRVTTVAHEEGLTDPPLHLFFPLPRLQSSTAAAK